MSLLALLALIAIALGIYCLFRSMIIAGIALVIVGLVILGGGITLDNDGDLDGAPATARVT